jgi:hypothetical protein
MENEKPKCEHKSIIIKEESFYTLPCGYSEYMDSEEVDLGECFIQSNQVAVVCDDCGEQID